MKYIIEVKDKDGNYINSTEFHLLKENPEMTRYDIIEWSFNHLKNHFHYFDKFKNSIPDPSQGLLGD